MSGEQEKKCEDMCETPQQCPPQQCEDGASCPPQPVYEQHYERRPNRGGYGGNGRGRGGQRPMRDNRQGGGMQYQGRDNRQGGGMRDNRRSFNSRPPYRARPFVLDFNRFLNRPEIHERIMGNFAYRMEQGDTLEQFYWAAPPLNDFGVGETLSIRFSGETEIHQYLVMAKFLRGEVEWVNAMPDNAKFDFRLKKVT